MDAEDTQEHKASAPASGISPKLEAGNDPVFLAGPSTVTPSLELPVVPKGEGQEVPLNLDVKSTGPESGNPSTPNAPQPIACHTDSNVVEAAVGGREANTEVKPAAGSSGAMAIVMQDGKHEDHDAGDNGEVDEDEDEDADEEDEDEDEDEDDIEDPSEDIKGDLEDILSGDLEFTGAFSFHRAYPTAPNPALNIDGLGTVGLPLSARDAAAIKACAEQAPFGKVDQTIVDKTVRDTWEIDATKVHFENDAWAPFITQTVHDVCQVLGVNVAASKPQCELYKLLLYETGSHFLPHVDTEKVTGMFATVVVVLPSRFTGGAVHVRHGDLHSSYDCSVGSLTNTSVLAWYTDVEHEVKAITSGYRLALSFNLIHTTNALRPMVSASTLPSRLQHVLRSWKKAEDHGDAPKKIIYLLSHKYSLAALKGSALKGVDAHLVAILDSVGKEHGIHIGLANLTCTESGTAEDYGGGYGRRSGWGRRCYYDDSPDEDDVDMGEVEDTNVTIAHLVDLDGKVIRNVIDYDLETEVIPEGLVDEITSGEYDDQSYEGYQGNYAGTVERIYRRTVLAMWPSWAHFDIMHGSEGFTYACQKIRESKTLQPTPEETEMTEIILVRANSTTCGAVVDSVCRAALRWKDLSLWFRAVKACDAERSIVALGEQHIYLAVAAFGFSEVKPCLERALERDPSNVSVLQFLEKFEIWVAAQNSPALTDATKDWVSAQRTKRFNALKPVGKDQHKALIALALKYGGGVDFLENKVLPLIKPTSDSAALLEFAKSLHSEESIPAETRTRLARDLLATALAKVDFYASVPAANTGYHSYLYSYSKPAEEPGQLERIKPYIKACLELGSEEILTTAVDKLLALSGLANDVVVRRVKGVLLPIIAYIEEISRTIPGGVPPSAVRKISTTTSTLHLRSALADPQRLLVSDVPALVQAVVANDKPAEALAQVVAKLERVPLQTPVLHSIIEELGAKRAQIDSTWITVNPHLLRLLQKYINALDLTYRSYGSTTYVWGGAPRPAAQKPAIAALEFCFTLKLPDACKFVLGRLLNPPKLDAKYVQEQLAPLVPDMRALLVKHKQPLSSEPFATTFRNIMLQWVLKVMGPRPPDTVATLLGSLKNWTCSCDICLPVRTFLTAKPEESMSWHRIGAPKRRHVESYLQTYARQVATFATIRSSPQGITVTKTKAIVGPAKWAHAQAEGKKLLRSISTHASELQTILGPDYPRIVAGLEGRSVATSTATTAPVAGASSAATAPRADASSSTTATPVVQSSPSAVRPTQATAAPAPRPQPVFQSVFRANGPAAGAPVAATAAATAGLPHNFQAYYATHSAALPAGVQVAQAGRPATAVQTSAVGASAPSTSGSSVGASSSAKRPDDAEHAQRKRRKMAYDDQDVIDLT